MARQLVLDPAFERAADWICSSFPSVRQFIESAKRILPENPRIGKRLPDGTWLLVMPGITEAKVWLVYTFYDDVVIFYEVKVWLRPVK